jgi:hypothetical protein
VILQIDVTVTGPDSVMTGSVAVDVNVPPAEQAPPAPPAQSANQVAQARSRSMRWGMR